LSSKGAVEGWKLAGQSDPTRPSSVANTIRTLAVELHIPDKKGKLIQFYFILVNMPHSGTKYTQQDYIDTIQQLQNVLDKCPKHAIPIIGGDFNATIGTDQNQDNQPVTGKYGNDQKSENGMQLREFMEINKLTSTATHFQKANHNTWSWQGNGTNEKQIDHIMTKRTELKRFINVETTGGVISDHKAIIATIRIAKHIPKKSKINKK
jgi:hypothetical protein